VRDTKILKTHCSQFIHESAGLPLFKALPATYSDLHRVKVRMQKKTSLVSEAFNQAFNDFYNLRQRAIFAYATPPALTEGTDSFYVFPVDGYKFLYSKAVTNSGQDYQQVVDTLIEKVDDISKATDIVTDLLKYSYTSENLHEGIVSESEIILYGIPQYYVVRVSACQNYARLILR